MEQQREATTDRLVGIIASIKMARKSGQLIVRRGEGLTVEEGMLIFTQGQVTQASVGRRSGSDALNWLSTWRQTRYIFIPAASEEKVSDALSLSSPALQDTFINTNITNRVNTDSLEQEHPAGRTHGIACVIVDLSEATARLGRAGLSRAHRRLYLLIDGHRSLADLVLLMGKDATEVRNMLNDLAKLGIIRITSI